MKSQPKSNYPTPYFLAAVLVHRHVKIVCVHWHGNEPLTLIVLTWRRHSTKPLDTLEPCHSLGAVAPDMPSQTCPISPLCLPVFAMTNGPSPQFFTPLSEATGSEPNHLGHWELILPWTLAHPQSLLQALGNLETLYIFTLLGSEAPL